MAGVLFRSVNKRYGDVSVIDDLDLEIRDREMMVLVGPSGCGKSTALRMIAGLEEITSGTIAIGDHVVNDLPPKERDIAMVFQSYALYPHMTVRENLAFGLRMRNVPRPEIERLVSDAAEILEITHLLDRKPKQLSGGQRQRVAVGRAIVRHPAVFLFDEPLSNLDAKLRVQMRAEITRLQRRLETTSVYVTHDQVEAMTMGDRIAVMRAGKIQQVGPPLEVYSSPANLFVAQFIGTPEINILDARIGEDGATMVSMGVTLPAPANLPAGSGREIKLGVRPEHVLLAAADSPVRLEAVVEMVEPLGHQSIVHTSVDGTRLVAALPAEVLPRSGDRIGLTFDAHAFHLFDAATGERI
ncbi:MAG: sn-glycerol-3-phosphate ABC transporter ATP-binding protein UgpC [Thermoanaerobaculia bacterium]